MKHESEKTEANENISGDIITLEKKLSILMLNSEESFVLVNTNFNIVAFNRQFNKQYLKYFGTEVKQGSSIFNLVLPERVDTIKKIYSKVFAGSTEESELELPLPNKQSLIILSKYKPAFDEQGSIMGAFVTSSDVTSIRKIEREKNDALKQIEFDNRNYRALIDSSNDMIWSIDDQYRIINCNSTFDKYVKKLTGKTAHTGSNILLYFNDRLRSTKYKEFCDRALKGESFRIIDHFFAPEPIWREVSFNPIQSSIPNLFAGVACISRDITEQKIAEKKVKMNKKRLAQAQKIAHLGSWHYDFKTGLIALSDEAFRMFGIENNNSDIPYEQWISHIHIDDSNIAKQTMDEAIQSRQNFHLHYRACKTDGSIINVYSESILEKGEDNTITGLHGIIQDVTERVQKELELQKFLNLTKKQNEWLNNFTYIVSHNIRSNNNNIKSLTELLDEVQHEDEERKHVLDMLKTSTEKLDETIQNLAEFIRFQNHSEKQFLELNLCEEINKTCSAVNQLLEETNSVVVNDVDKDIIVQVVPSFIESILLNLMTNAIKYRSDKRDLCLKFSCEKEVDCVKLIIEDNGIGLDLKKHGDNVFGLFKTFHNNKDAVGFGLFMTKNQMELMNGKIEIQSTPDIGTKFTLLFYEKN